MSQKNPYKRLVKLKVLVDEDAEGRREAIAMAAEMRRLRPKVRGDCLTGGINEQRPCPWYGCEAHLGLDINESTGSMMVRNLEDMVHTCAFDVAEIGGIPGSGRGTGVTLEEIGEIMDLTRERVRQIEVRGSHCLKPTLIDQGLAPDGWNRGVKKLEPGVMKRAKLNPEQPTENQESTEKPLDSEDEQD